MTWKRDAIPALGLFVALLMWTTYAYLTIRVDGDILAEAIAVQRWLDSPYWTLSYPGQLYGGVAEYPFIALAETVTPGNVYGFTFIRIFYIPVTGVLLALVFRLMYPTRSLWPLALGAVAGPAAMHSMMAIKDLYPSSWLLTMIGVATVAWQLARGRRAWLVVVGGIFIGLGVSQHPTSLLLGAPLLTAVLVHWRAAVPSILRVVIGGLLGLLPFFLGLLAQPTKVVVFAPAREGLPNVLGALGLSWDTDSWAQAFVPIGWGVQFTDYNIFALPLGPQFLINALIALTLLTGAVLSIPALGRYLRREPVRDSDALVVLWGATLLSVIVITLVTRPVWFYGTGLGFITWFAIAALFGLPNRIFARGAAVALVILMATTSIGAFLAPRPSFPESIGFKMDQAREVETIASDLEAAGIEYLFGSYWEVLPIAYASRGALQPITVFTNRFTVSEPLGDEVLLAAPDGRTVLPVDLDRWVGSAEADAFLASQCRPTTVDDLPEGFSAFRCPVAALQPDGGGGGI
jgi:hypothetical protein